MYASSSWSSQCESNPGGGEPLPTSASFPLTTTCVPVSHALAAPSADVPLHRRRSIACWVAMPPKKVSFKAPAAPSSPSNPIAHSDDPAARLRSLLQPPSQPAVAGKTKLASASTSSSDVASLKADLVDLQEKYDILMETYEHKHANFRALTVDHTALQGQFECLTAKLERVSNQLSAFHSAAASASTSPRPLTKDYTLCVVQMDPIPAITAFFFFLIKRCIRNYGHTAYTNRNASRRDALRGVADDHLLTIPKV